MSGEPTSDNTTLPAKNRLKQTIERELIQTAPTMSPPKFSQTSHSQEAPTVEEGASHVLGADLLEELPVDKDLEGKIQEFARRLASAKS